MIVIFWNNIGKDETRCLTGIKAKPIPMNIDLCWSGLTVQVSIAVTINSQ